MLGKNCNLASQIMLESLTSSLFGHFASNSLHPLHYKRVIICCQTYMRYVSTVMEIGAINRSFGEHVRKSILKLCD